MSKLVKSEAGLEEELKRHSQVFVLFYASWCPYSREFLPEFENYAAGCDMQFCRVLTDQASACEAAHHITVVPTVIFFKNGRAVKRLDGIPGGGLSKGQLDKLVKSCRLEKPKEKTP